MTDRFNIDIFGTKEGIFQRLVPLIAFTFFLNLLAYSEAFAANPRVPSQALPKMFRGQSAPDYYDIKKQSGFTRNSSKKIPISKKILVSKLYLT